jgi:3-polyprenyl-4-hydroxybenzoate decarboxylase
LIDLDEVEIPADPTPLTVLSQIIENTQKAVLFKQAGPERVELIAKAAGSRKRLIAAFDSTPEKVYEDFLNRSANPKKIRGGSLRRGARPRHQDHRQGRRPDETPLPSPT